MLTAIEKELTIRKNEFSSVEVATIYFGGGTPSLLSATEITQLIDCVKENYKVVADPEITLEANPDDLQLATIKALAETAVNRLSIGIQSIYDADLKMMNRAHTSEEAKNCITMVQGYFDNCSIDLIYGIPGLTDAQWEQTLAWSVALQVPHISAYALTVEPKTALAHFIKEGTVANVDDEQAERQFQFMVRYLEEQGFVNYEISNFGKEDFFSKNNTAYWQGKPYLGIGPSAHSFNGTKRGWNVRNNPGYIKAMQQGKVPITWEELSTRDRYNEYVMTGLRTIWGISLNEIEDRFGRPYQEYLVKQSEKYVKDHLLFWDGDTLLTTKKGKFLADGIASDLFMLNLK